MMDDLFLDSARSDVARSHNHSQSDNDILSDAPPSILDADQREGVSSDAALTLISAGAGTGKTTTLVHRIVRLINSGTPANGILAVTFTRYAASEMKNRAIALGGSSVRGVFFGTIHALAAAIVRRWPLAAGLRDNRFAIIDDDEQLRLIRSIMKSSHDGDYMFEAKDPSRFVRDRIQQWKENGLLFRHFEDDDRPDLSHEDEGVFNIWRDYHETMTSGNLVEFADLAPMATLVLRSSHEAGNYEFPRIKHVLVDEWQDTNASQIEFISMLTSAGAKLTVVGDDDQSLYSFRGAIPNLMDRTHQIFPEIAARGMCRVNLVTNRRCTREILKPANLIVDYNPRHEPKVLNANKSGEIPVVKAYTSYTKEAEGVARDIEHLISDGVNPENISILVRTHSVAGDFDHALYARGIPHIVAAGINFADRAEVKDVLSYLRLCFNPRHEMAFERIAARPARGLGPASVKAVIAYVREHNAPIHDALTALSSANGLREQARIGAEDLGIKLSYLVEADRAGEETLDMINYIINDINYLSCAPEEFSARMNFLASLDRLRKIAAEYPVLSNFLDTMAISSESDIRSGGKVYIGTLHGAKGLEWDHVFLPCFEEGIFPSPMALRSEGCPDGDGFSNPWSKPSQGGLYEERRLAHVGMTRAKIAFHVSYSGFRIQYNKKNSCRPSRFLKEAEMEVPRPQKVISKRKGASFD